MTLASIFAALRLEFSRFTVEEDPAEGQLIVYVPGGRLSDEVAHALLDMKPAGISLEVEVLPWWKNWLVRRQHRRIWWDLEGEAI